MSSNALICSYCSNPFPDSRTSCPHCARPQLFPNVAKATNEAERDKLNAKFEQTKQSCQADGRAREFEDFYTQTGASQALFACSTTKLHREISSETEIFETYYQLEALRLRSSAPKSLDWEKLRPQAESELLGSNKNIENLHYACLSMDWSSLSSYGECVVKLKETMIAHRASCFGGNTAVIYFIEHDFSKCLRSNWEDRGKIAAAALGERLRSGDGPKEFAQILLTPAVDSVDDNFIEVHIFGTMTARTFAEVKFTTNASSSRDAVYREAIIEKLNLASVRHS